MTRIALIVFVFGCSFSFLAGQSIIYVPDDVDSIQDALDMAEEGTTILVAPGTYFENLDWPKVDGIKLISEEGKDSTIIDGQNQGRVIHMSGSSSSPISNLTEIQGFTIQNGYGFNSSAGIYIYNAGASLSDLKIINNTITGGYGTGAGAGLFEYSGTIENCEFSNNLIDVNANAQGGGLAIVLKEGGDVILNGCVFDSNNIRGGDKSLGGGMFLSNNAFDVLPKIKFQNCTFNNNSTNGESISDGGGLYIDHSNPVRIEIEFTNFSNNNCGANLNSKGGAIYFSVYNNGPINISNCDFFSNTATRGLGIFFNSTFNEFGGVSILNCEFKYHELSSLNIADSGVLDTGFGKFNMTLENTVIANNEGYSIFEFGTTEQRNLNIKHSTFTRNGGPIFVRSININASNSIFWENGTVEFGNPGYSFSEMNLQNCIVKNGWQGVGIIDQDPLFISQDLFVPSEDSPCLGNGIPSGLSTDILGNARPMPANSDPDIGAYEIDQYFAHVQVKFFLDENQNGTKETEEQYSSLGSIVKNNELVYNNFRTEGLYIIADQGPLNIAYNYNWSPNWTITNQAEYSFSVDADDFSEIIEIGLTPLFEIRDIQVVLTNDNFRCGELVDFRLTANNRGTSISEGIVWLEIDERIGEATFEIEPDYNATENMVGWDFQDLFPGECIDIDFQVIAPLIENEDEVGELYCFNTWLEPENNESPNSSTNKAELRCAYDPNDKQVNPFREDNLALADHDLLYTIRFQNTGNDYARNVVVTDTIHESLDMTSFELINTSHPDQLLITIQDERAVRFEFNGIYLPDSLTNEPESHGFINFTIRPLEDVALNTNITNTAFIYFDFNPAIITNTTESIMVDEFPIVNIKETDQILIHAYPNPASSTIYLSDLVDKVFVYDAQGKLVSSVELTQEVNVKLLEAGTYFVEYWMDGEVGTDRWVIVR